MVLFLFLITGIIIGYFNLVSKKVLNKAKSVPMISLVAILFLMGNKIGMSPQVFKNINSIGLKALFISLGSIMGSIIFMRIIIVKDKSIKERQEI